MTTKSVLLRYLGDSDRFADSETGLVWDKHTTINEVSEADHQRLESYTWDMWEVVAPDEHKAILKAEADAAAAAEAERKRLEAEALKTIATPEEGNE